MNKITIDGKTIKLSDETVREIRKILSGKPKFGEEYCYIDDNTIIFNSFSKDDIDEARLEVGNYYSTKEEAKKELDRRTAIVRVKNYIAENGIEVLGGEKNRIEVLGWEENRIEVLGGVVSSSIMWDYAYNSLYIMHSSAKGYSPIGFFSEKDAETLIENCADDLEIIIKQ